MSHAYDVVVIGAGIGGLTAAALSAHDGLSTLVLEAHNRPGGCAGDFALNGVLFPAGATLMSGFEAGGLHAWVYRRLGIAGRAVALERAMEVVFDERRFSLWTDRDRWRDEAGQTFAGGGPARKRFFDWSEQIGGVVHRLASRLPVMPPRTLTDLLRLSMTFRPEVLRSIPYLARTVGDVMAESGADRDPAFRQFVDAQLLDATGCESGDCAAVNGAIALDLYHRGCFAVPGGTATVARDLVRAARRHGGAVTFETPVVGLRRQSGRYWQVRMADGNTVRARTVVSNGAAWDLPALLGEADHRRHRRVLRLRRHGWGAFVMHAAVDPAVLPDDRFAHFQTLPPPGAALTEGGMCFITVMEPSVRPGAPRAVSVSTHTDVRRWWGIDPAAYQEQKQQYAERLLSACERAMPGFRRGLVFHQSATPPTFAFYTLRSDGIVGGVRTDRRHSTFGALSHHSGVPGLYRCGDTVFPGQGTIGVTLSGINAWRSVRDHLGLGFGRWHRRVARQDSEPDAVNVPAVEPA